MQVLNALTLSTQEEQRACSPWLSVEELTKPRLESKLQKCIAKPSTFLASVCAQNVPLPNAKQELGPELIKEVAQRAAPKGSGTGAHRNYSEAQETSC